MSFCFVGYDARGRTLAVAVGFSIPNAFAWHQEAVQ